jgi:hypothetical protein
MAYLTYHVIYIEPFKLDVLNNVLDKLNKEGEWFEIDKFETSFRIESEHIAWYSCHEDILEMSKEFPDITFIMYTTGEDGESDLFTCLNGCKV